MRNFKFVLSFCLIASLFSCQKEESLTTESTSQDAAQSITFHYGKESVDLEYTIEDDQLVLLSELPEDLKALQKDENMYLEAGEDGHLWLQDQRLKQSAATTRESFDDMGVYDEFMNELGLDEINHYAFIIDNREAGLRSYGEAFDIRSYYLPVLSTKKYFKDGLEQDYTVELAFGFSGGNQIELLNVDPSQDNIFANEVGTGIHHIAFSSENLEESIALFNDNGYETIVTGEFVTRLGMVSNIAFLDTKDEIGAYTEIVESKLLGFNVSQDESLLILGLFLGDTKLYCL